MDRKVLPQRDKKRCRDMYFSYLVAICRNHGFCCSGCGAGDKTEAGAGADAASTIISRRAVPIGSHGRGLLDLLKKFNLFLRAVSRAFRPINMRSSYGARLRIALHFSGVEDTPRPFEQSRVDFVAHLFRLIGNPDGRHGR